VAACAARDHLVRKFRWAAILIPSLNRWPILMQREVGSRYGEQATRLFDVLVPVVIILGVVRGTLLGPIKDVGDVFGSSYGITWLVALVAAIATFLWGRIVINGALRRLNARRSTLMAPRRRI